MFDYLLKKAESLGLYAIYGEAIMFHPFSQKANLKHGMIETALQLGEVASWIAQKDIKFEKIFLGLRSEIGVLISLLDTKEQEKLKDSYLNHSLLQKYLLEQMVDM